MIQFDMDSDKPIRIPEELKDELAKYRRQAKKIRIMISPVFEGRTLSQNALFHKKLHTIEILTGYSWEDAKHDIKVLAVSMGYPFQRDEHGEPKVDKDGNLIPISSAKASISDMKKLMTALDEWCFQHQVDLQEVWNE